MRDRVRVVGEDFQFAGVGGERTVALIDEVPQRQHPHKSREILPPQPAVHPLRSTREFC